MNEVNHVCSFPEFSPPTDMYKNVKKKKKTQGPCISQESGKEAIRWHREWMKDSLDAMDGFQATRKVCQFTKSSSCPGTESTGRSGITEGLWVPAPWRTARAWARAIFPEEGSLLRNGVQIRERGEISRPLISTTALISCQCLPMAKPLSNHKS